MLDDLIDRYGPGAVVRAGPYAIGDDPNDWRWIVEIDGADVSDVDIRVREEGTITAVLLVRNDEEIELGRFPTDRPAAAVGVTLRQLRDASAS